MPTRREFFSVAAAAAASPLFIKAASADKHDSAVPVGGALPLNDVTDKEHYRPRYRFGLGGVAIGTGFEPLSAARSDEVMQAAWSTGVRYFDTSPWYGLGVGERRMAHFLHDKSRDDYVISTKIGRILTPADEAPDVMWKAPSPFDYRYDYTADGTKKSIEDSLHRMGMSRIDIVFVHDLAEDHLGDEWKEHFEVAVKGAFPALEKMRDEGVIKAWGLGVNKVEPCLRALEEADPDLFLLATQYSIVEHEEPLKELFPKCDDRGVTIVAGAPFNSGFLAGKERYNYEPEVPEEKRKKGEQIEKIAREFDTDLRTAALHFCNAPSAVSSVIPGASTAAQAIENALSIARPLPSEFWEKLRREKLISDDAPTPG